MARKKKAPIENVIDLVSRFPWWLCAILSLISFLILHTYASRPIMPAAAQPLPTTGPVSQIYANALFHGIYVTAAKFGQIILPLIFGFAALVSAIKSYKQKKLYEGVASRPDAGALNEMSWKEFEILVGEFFRRRGFAVTQTNDGADGGVDLILRKDAEKHLVQCKQWKAYKVGVQPVRELYGVMASTGAAGGYFVTSGVYTEEARAFAQGLNIQLIDGQRLRSMISEVRQQGRVGVAAPAAPGGTHQASAPDCPKCGSEMIKRRARKGSNAGNEFWGCPNYPRCSGVINI